jgi:arginine decarboxylase
MLAFYFAVGIIRTGFGPDAALSAAMWSARALRRRAERPDGDGPGRCPGRIPKEVAMIWKKVTKVAVTAGCAEGGTALNAFDNALLAAGIGNVNLVKVSSIVPPDVDIVDLPAIKPGSIVPTAYAAMASETPGELVTAAVGYALPEDRTKAGVIMEFHGVGDRRTAEAAIGAMLAEAMAVRGERIREQRIAAVEHRVRTIGCALAAIPLLSEDDLL